MNIRENFLRTVEFRNPEWVPCTLSISPLAKKKYGKNLDRIFKDYHLIFKRDTDLHNEIVFKGIAPNYKKGYFKDSWGCIWHNNKYGLEGQVIKHPLENWDAFKTYKAPDPLAIRLNEYGQGTFDWKKIEEDVKIQRKKGAVIWGCGERLFDRLCFIRGFTNLFMDFATDNPNLPILIEMLCEYEKKLIKKWLDVGIDAIWFHTDIGTQTSLMISPEKFRKYLKSMFKELFIPCRDSGVHVYLSTDGRVLEILNDFIECGVSMHNPQLGAISMEEINKNYIGKMCIYLYLDQQKFPFLEPEGVKQMIKESVDLLNTPQGGLILWAGIYDDTVPIENVEAICQAFIKYCFKIK